MTTFTAHDYRHMSLALSLAERGRCSTSPNPRVGCVLAKGADVVASGWHQKAGEAHAEIVALQQLPAEVDGRQLTAYVTLEPCNHTGKTPPCTQALIGRRIARVVVAMPDPNPLVAGQGIAQLRAAGIEVTVGLLAEAAQQLNVGFSRRMTAGMPWIRVKSAQSADGAMALSSGESQWITDAAARHDGHRLRARSCAVVTGSGTVITDNPRLTVRHIAVRRQPLRVVVDSRLTSPVDAHIISAGTVVFCDAAHYHRHQPYTDLGCVCHGVAATASGRLDLQQVVHVLAAEHQVNELLVEAGPKLTAGFFQQHLVDEWWVYLAAKVLGASALPVLALPEPERLAQALEFTWGESRFVGQCLRLIGRFDR